MESLTLADDWLTITYFAIIGMCMGSFLNVFVHRWPIMRGMGQYADGFKLKSLQDKHGSYSLIVPRSECPCCETPLKTAHAIPLIGWALMRGKCKACGQRVLWKYPATELVFGLGFAGYIFNEGVSLAGLISLPMMCIAYCFIVFRMTEKYMSAALGSSYVALVLLQILLSNYGLGRY
jgi:prepilin signal peptidase PulO-like enzyme (type II secretory pathway)